MSDDQFVYFDGVAALGQYNGVIQLELVANVLVSAQEGNVKIRKITTANLRCSPSAAMDLLQAISKALMMLQSQDKASVAPEVLN